MLGNMDEAQRAALMHDLKNDYSANSAEVQDFAHLSDDEIACAEKNLLQMDEYVRKVGLTVKIGSDCADGDRFTEADFQRVTHGADPEYVDIRDSDVIDDAEDNISVFRGVGRFVYANQKADDNRRANDDLCTQLFLAHPGCFTVRNFYSLDTVKRIVNALITVVIDGKEEKRKPIVVEIAQRKFIQRFNLFLLPGYYVLGRTNFLTLKDGTRTVAVRSGQCGADGRFIFADYYFTKPTVLSVESRASACRYEPAGTTDIFFAMHGDELAGFLVCGLTRFAHMFDRHPVRIFKTTGGQAVAVNGPGHYEVCEGTAIVDGQDVCTVDLVDTAAPDTQDLYRNGVAIEFLGGAAPKGQRSRSTSALLLIYGLVYYHIHKPASVSIYARRWDEDGHEYVMAHVAQFYHNAVDAQLVTPGSPTVTRQQQYLAALAETGLMRFWQKYANGLTQCQLKYTAEEWRILCEGSDVPSRHFYSLMKASADERGLVDIAKMFALSLVTASPYVYKDPTENNNDDDDKTHSHGLMFAEYLSTEILLKKAHAIATSVLKQQLQPIQLRCLATIAAKCRQNLRIEEFMASADTEDEAENMLQNVPQDVRNEMRHKRLATAAMMIGDKGKIAAKRKTAEQTTTKRRRQAEQQTNANDQQ